MDILDLFKRHLLSNSSTSSKSTLKNYLSDVRHFMSWFEKTTKASFEAKNITTSTILLYEKTLGGIIEDGRLNPSTQLSLASLKRHLSSLRKFFAVLEKEGYISQNPFTQIQPVVNETPTDLWHLNSFRDALLLQRASKITVKNYLSDIAGFAKWYEETILPGLEKPLSATGGFYLITQEILEDYRKRLLEVQNAAPRTVNRKLSALRRYLNFATEKGFVTPSELTIDPVKIYEERISDGIEPTVELNELPIVTQKERRHSKIPPVRLVQKLFIFPYLSLEEKAATSIASFIAGKPLSGVEKLPPKLAAMVAAKNSLRSKTNSVSNILGVRNISKEFYAPEKVSLLGTPLYKRFLYHAKFTRPNWYKKYHNYSFVHYVHFALLVIFAAGVGVALYQNLVAKKQLPTFAAATAPPRIISFQGRLTDNLDNPITSTSALRFAIYNDASASGGALLWQEAITNIVPDQDGIFSILLGGGTQIPSTVFTDNSQIYLGVTVGTTSELTPRQRIASVGYATNAEFLQGQPPTTQAGITSFTNVILALDSSGNLTLSDSAVTSHTFQVSNGAFNLKGQSLYLTTNTGSGGNVILSPDGFGKIDIQRPIINTTTMGNLVSGGVEVNDRFGVLATESAVAAFIVNNNTSGGDIFAASSSGTTRFKIANDGTLTDGVYNTAGGIFYGSNSSGTFAQTTVGALGQCLQSTAGGAPTWGTCGGSDWRTSLGALSPNNDTLDLLVGGITTASAKFRFTNVNSGTPVASISANNGNNATFISGDGTLGTTNRQTLTIGNSSTYNSTGNLLFNPNGIGKIGIGTTAPLIGFDLRGNSGTTAAASISANTSFATLVVDNSGSGDLIVASSSGVPNFIVRNNGDVIVGQGGNGKITVSVIDPYLVQNQKTTGTQSLTFQTMGATNADFIFKNTSTTLSTLTQAGQLQLPITGSTGGIVIGGDTQLFRGAADRLDVASGDSFNVVNGNLQIGGTTVIDSSRNGTFQTLNITGGCTGCTVGAPSPFQALNGAIVPLNGTLDLLLGSQATASAKFAILNISNGTPTASVSATSTGAGLSIAGDGSLQGTLNNNIVIGGNTTGAIQFKPNNSSVNMFLSGANVAIGNQNPQASLDVSQNSHLSAAVDKIIFGSIGNTIGVLGYDGAANDEIRIGAQSNNGLELLTNNTTQAYITNTGNFGIGTTSPTAKLDVNGTASVSGQLALYTTPTIQSTAFQSLTLGGNTTGDIQFKPGNASSPSLYLQTGGNVGIGTTTPSYALQVVKTSAGAETQPLFLNNRDSANGSAVSLTFGAVNGDTVTGKIINTRVGGSNYALSFHTFGATGLFEAARFDQNGNLGIGTTSPTAPLHVNAGKFGGNAAFIVNQTGVTTNDIFAASSSGTTKFTIKNDGTASSSAGFTIDGAGALQSTKNQTLTIGGSSTGSIVLSPNNGSGSLQFTNFTTNGGILYTNVAGVLAQTGAGSAVQCLLGNLSWGTCSTGTTASPFFENAGTIAPFNTTEDFLIGGQATTSAKFGVLNVTAPGGTVPTASVSSGLNGTSAYFDANGNFRTANKMSLTIGGGNTGNIVIQGNGSTTIVDQTIRLNGVNPTFSANGSSTLTLNNNSTGNIQFFSSSNTITSAGALSIAGSATINGGTVQLANGAQGTIQTTSNADIVITAGSGTINLNTVSNGAVLTGSGLTTLGGGLTVNGTTTTFGNAAPIITTGTNTDLTITPNGTGNLIITSDFNTGIRIGSSSNTPALLSVSGGIGSNAGFILNRVGTTDDIFAASSAGITKFVIKNDGTASTSGNLVLDGASSLQTTKNQTLTLGGNTTGNIRFANFSINNGLLYTNGSGVLSQTGAGTALQCLLGDLTWGSCGTGTNRSPFQELLGAIVQNNTTEDFLAGGQATTSAVFKVTGQGNPFAGTLVGASISANTSFAGFLADNKGVGDLLAASSSGVTQFVIRNNGAVGIGTNIPGAMLDVNGNLLLGANSTIDVRASGTLTIGNGTNTSGLILGKSGVTTTFNSTSWTATPTISGLVTGTLGFSVAAGQSYTGAGAVTFSSASNNDLTIASQGSGNTVITSDFDTGVRIGTSINTPAALSVSGGIGSNAGFILNRVGATDDIFAASSSGTTKFVIKNDGTASSSAGFTIDGSGNIQSTKNQTLTIGGGSTGNLIFGRASQNLFLPAFTTNGGLLYTTTTGLLTQLGAGSSSQCLTANTGAAPSWGSCGSSSVGTWNLDTTNKIHTPINNTVDIVVGGTSTASAKFAILNIAGGTPTASVSSGLNGSGTYFDANGTIQTTNKQTLTFGGSTTGNMALMPNNGLGSVSVGTTDLSPFYTLLVRNAVGGGAASFESTGANPAILSIDNLAGGNQSVLNFYDASVIKYQVGKSADNSFFIYDNAASRELLYANGGNLAINGFGGKTGIGTLTPVSHLHVTRALSFGTTGKALAIFDQIENQDILTASAAGSTKLVLNNSGYLGIGTSLPVGEIHVSTSNTASIFRGINSDQHNDGVNAAVINLRKSRGTELNPTTVANADNIGNISFYGYGTAYTARAQIIATVNGAVSSDIVPTDLRFLTGSATVAEAMRISSLGKVGIGILSSPTGNVPQAQLHVYGSANHEPVASISARSTSTAPVLLVTGDGSNDLFVASVSGQPKFRIDSSGGIHNNGGLSNDYGDFAEYYKKANSSESFEAGQLVCIENNGVTKCRSNSSSQRILGIISDRSFLRGNAAHANDPNYVLVGMVGQLGIWTNGNVKAGDPLTFSSTPGVATVATSSNNIIGYAQEGNNGTLKRIESVIQPNYFNPNTALQNDNVFNSLTLGIQNGVYTVFDALGNSINHIDAFSKAIIGDLTAGLARVQTLVATTFTATTSSLGNATASTFAVAANTITIGGQDIRQFIIDTVRNAGFGQGPVVSPIASSTVKTNVISPLADNSSIQLNANKDNFELKNIDTGKTVAWFGNQGTATFSGQLISDGIQTTNATVSGTLAASSINTTDASVSGTITANTIVANNISGLDQKLATLAAALQNNNSASNSGQNTNNYLASDTIHANFGIFEQGITSMGPVTSNIITATDQLAVGNSFTITNNSINTVGADLQIQSLRQGNIAFEGGLIKMDTDGNMLVSGNLNLLGEIDAVHGVFSGTLTAPALATGLISPLPGDDLAIKLSDSASTSGRLKIVNQKNQEVLSINSRGDLNASGSGTFAKLNFNLVGKAEATSLTEAVATGSAGFATLRQGQVELTIKNPIITSKSLIYITPFGDTNNKVIYLLRQVPQSEVDDGSFTVGISGTPAPQDIQFNWLVVN